MRENLSRSYWVGLLLLLGVGMGIGSACSVDSAKNHYLLAEKLWTDKKYSAAVSEFEKVMAKDPRGNLGLQATFRAATTEYLFLSKYGDAVRKFQDFIQISGDPRLIWEAQLHVGEIFYSKTEQHDQAILHYRSLLQQKPTASLAPEFLYRIAKSHYFLFQFDEASSVFEEIIQKYPKSPFAEKAAYALGETHLTRGEAFEEAKRTFEKFVKTYPKSPLVPEAQFGIASSLEELDQLDEAFNAFSSLKKTYPSPAVIDIKLNRIRQRISLRRTFR